MQGALLRKPPVRDPYSTPARRRRIVAEVARDAVRSFYISACNHAVVFRRETAAAINLQCFFRGFLSRKHVANLLIRRQFAAAGAIQRHIRGFLVRQRLKHRIEHEKENMAEKLNKLVNIRWRRYRKRRVRLKEAAKKSRKRSLEYASIIIQRYTRGFLARRRIVKQRFRYSQESSALKVIQAPISRFVKRTRERMVMISSANSKSHTGSTITRTNGNGSNTGSKRSNILPMNPADYWEKERVRRQKENRAVLRIQNVSRGFIVRNKLKRMRESRVKEEEEIMRQQEEQEGKATILLQQQIEEEQRCKAAELEAIIAAAAVAEAAAAVDRTRRTRRLQMHLHVQEAVLRKLVDAGVGSVVQWCIHNSILRYRHSESSSAEKVYALGAMLLQVVRKMVEMYSHSKTRRNLTTNQQEKCADDVESGNISMGEGNDDEEQDQRHEIVTVTISHWEVDENSKYRDNHEPPPSERRYLPSNWGEEVIGGRGGGGDLPVVSGNNKPAYAVADTTTSVVVAAAATEADRTTIHSPRINGTDEGSSSDADDETSQRSSTTTTPPSSAIDRGLNAVMIPPPHDHSQALSFFSSEQLPIHGANDQRSCVGAAVTVSLLHPTAVELLIDLDRRGQQQQQEDEEKEEVKNDETRSGGGSDGGVCRCVRPLSSLVSSSPREQERQQLTPLSSTDPTQYNNCILDNDGKSKEGEVDKEEEQELLVETAGIVVILTSDHVLLNTTTTTRTHKNEDMHIVGNDNLYRKSNTSNIVASTNRSTSPPSERVLEILQQHGSGSGLKSAVATAAGNPLPASSLSPSSRSIIDSELFTLKGRRRKRYRFSVVASLIPTAAALTALQDKRNSSSNCTSTYDDDHPKDHPPPLLGGGNTPLDDDDHERAAQSYTYTLRILLQDRTPSRQGQGEPYSSKYATGNTSEEGEEKRMKKRGAVASYIRKYDRNSRTVCRGRRKGEQDDDKEVVEEYYDVDEGEEKGEEEEEVEDVLDAAAACIQHNYRIYIHRKTLNHRSAVRIQLLRRRLGILRKWRSAVSKTLSQAHLAATTIQCSLRCALARRITRRARVSYCRRLESGIEARMQTLAQDLLRLNDHHPQQARAGSEEFLEPSSSSSLLAAFGMSESDTLSVFESLSSPSVFTSTSDGRTKDGPLVAKVDDDVTGTTEYYSVYKLPSSLTTFPPHPPKASSSTMHASFTRSAAELSGRSGASTTSGSGSGSRRLNSAASTAAVSVSVPSGDDLREYLPELLSAPVGNAWAANLLSTLQHAPPPTGCIAPYERLFVRASPRTSSAAHSSSVRPPPTESSNGHNGRYERNAPLEASTTATTTSTAAVAAGLADRDHDHDNSTDYRLLAAAEGNQRTSFGDVNILAEKSLLQVGR